MAWFCAQCGTKNPEPAAFCAECGAAREDVLEAAPGRRQPGKKPLLIGGIGLGLVAIALGLCLLLGVFGPRLYRTSYVRQSAVEEDGYQEYLQGEQYYFYHSDGTGRVENGSHEVIQRLQLNKRGQVVAASFQTPDGEEYARQEYEYDKRGNRCLTRYYTYGVLERQQESEFDADRAARHTVTRQYEDGREISRTEMDFPDKSHGTIRTYSEGVLTSEHRVERGYENGQLAWQQTYGLDGAPGVRIVWTRDADNNILRAEFHYPDGRVSITTNVYERIR